MKYLVKVTNDDLRNLRDAGFLAINNSFCLVLNEANDLEVSTWPGAGGTYFTDNPELNNVSSGDIVKVLLPNDEVKLFMMPHNF